MYTHVTYFEGTNNLYIRRQVGGMVELKSYRPTPSSVGRFMRLFDAWKQSKSVQRDILFGNTFEVVRYAYSWG